VEHEHACTGGSRGGFLPPVVVGGSARFWVLRRHLGVFLVAILAGLRVWVVGCGGVLSVA
jgi:hypothetical protein